MIILRGIFIVNKKPCPVCIYLKVYPEQFISELNNHIFDKGKYQDFLDLLQKSNVLNNKQKPSKHYVEKHRTDCLISFVPTKVSKSVNKLNNTKNENNVNDDQSSNNSLQEHLDIYRKMSVQERDNDHIERLKEIKYLSGIIIHHQLFQEKYSRSIPKEDISALKQVEDIIHSMKMDSKLSDLNINVRSIGDDIEE